MNNKRKMKKNKNTLVKFQNIKDKCFQRTRSQGNTNLLPVFSWAILDARNQHKAFQELGNTYFEHRRYIIPIKVKVKAGSVAHGRVLACHSQRPRFDNSQHPQKQNNNKKHLRKISTHFLSFFIFWWYWGSISPN
jgi:hypothetical protein